MNKSRVVIAILLAAYWPAAVRAAEPRSGGKLLLTGGVSNVEGAGGGGLATWATVTGGATRDGIGANAHATFVDLPDYQFRAYGLAVGLFEMGDREAGEAALRRALQDQPALLGRVTHVLAGTPHGRFFLRPSAAAAFLARRP